MAQGPPAQYPTFIRPQLGSPISGTAQTPVGHPAAINQFSVQYPSSGPAQTPVGHPAAINQFSVQYPSSGPAQPPVGHPAAVHRSPVQYPFSTPQAPPQCRTLPVHTPWQHSAKEKQYNVGGAVPSSVVVYNSNEVPSHVKQLVQHALGDSSQNHVPQQHAKKTKGKQSSGKKVKVQQAPPGQQLVLPTQAMTSRTFHPPMQQRLACQPQVLHAPPVQHPVNVVFQQSVATPQPRQVGPGMILSPPIRPALGTINQTTLLVPNQTMVAPSQTTLQVPNRTMLTPGQSVLTPGQMLSTPPSMVVMPNAQLPLHQQQMLQQNLVNPIISNPRPTSNNRSVLGTLNRAMDIAEPVAEAVGAVGSLFEALTC